ncbi:MAG: RNA methyltransferase [Planctomycetota bacterium]
MSFDAHSTDHRRTLAHVQATATRAGRERLGLCSLEGTRLFERAMAAGVTIERALTTAAFRADPTPRVRTLFARLEASACRVELVPEATMQTLTGGRAIGSLVGLARLPAPGSLDALLAHDEQGAPFFLGLFEVNDPGNLGALARTAHASGASALLAAGATDAFHPKALRTSMGSLFRLPVLAYDSLDVLLGELGARGVRAVGSVSSECDGATPLDAFDFGREPTALFVGSEAFGFGPTQRAAFDGLVTIPMAAGVDSYSVNAAAAVLLWELAQRRR